MENELPANKTFIEVEETLTTASETELKTMLYNYLSKKPASKFYTKELIFECSDAEDDVHKYIKTVTINGNFKPLLFNNTQHTSIHFYKNYSRNAEIETIENDYENDGDETAASNHWILPSSDFVGLWENLLYEDGLKDNILKFVETTMRFSRHGVNHNIITSNRIVLLHGPPGTGKTSLCKAIAQKLAIRLRNTYKFTHLVEINSHSLFSKWFSESGKLVMKLFAKIKELVENPKSLVCVLIDEVESIAYTRSSVSNNEPRDALRVVNAVLTQLDQIQKYPNVLILTTSNLTSTIDLAFIDRADIKQFIGYPSTKAIFEIYASSIRELIRVKLIKPDEIGNETFSIENGHIDCNNENRHLYKLAEQSIGLSGRALRKIPFFAHALFTDNKLPKVIEFLEAMSISLKKYKTDQDYLSKDFRIENNI